MKELFNIISVKDNVVTLPGIKKGYKKLNKILSGTSAVAISNELSSNEMFKNELYKMNVDILDGRYLFNFLCSDVVEYIAKANNSKLQEIELTFLANYLDDALENNILYLAEKCKLLNIITNNPEKFENIAENLRINNGIMIRVSKNKKKGLLKSGIVINFDFPQELLNKCNINNKAVIVNLNDKLNIKSKSFSGIIVNFYKINEQAGNLLQHYTDEIIYESQIYKLGNYATIREKIRKDNIRIKGLIGVNGIINIKEFSQNVLTKLEY